MEPFLSGVFTFTTVTSSNELSILLFNIRHVRLLQKRIISQDVTTLRYVFFLSLMMTGIYNSYMIQLSGQNESPAYNDRAKCLMRYDLLFFNPKKVFYFK
jgi:hypothetical protein